MAKPGKRSGSSKFQFRRATPRDIWAQRETLLALGIRVPREVSQSLGTADPYEAKKLQAQLSAEFDERCEGWRKALQTGPRTLTQKEVFAFAGEIAKKLIADHADNPGRPDEWQARDGSAQRKLLGTERSVAGLFQLVDRELARRGLIVSPESRQAILEQFVGQVDDGGRVIDAGDRGEVLAVLARMSRGDYSPSEVFEKRPRIEDWKQLKDDANPAFTFSQLLAVWESWRNGRKIPEVATRDLFKRHVEEFAAFLGHDDASCVTREDVTRYREELGRRTTTHGGKERPLSEKTIAERITTLTTVFNAAVKSAKLTSNPAEGQRPRGKTKPQRPFAEQEAVAILKAARKESGFRRWGPWLMAYGGMRVEEAAQLRKQDVMEAEGVKLLMLTPDAGTIKGGKSRHVPLHSKLIAEGFLAFVDAARGERLFPEACLNAQGKRFNARGKPHSRGSEIMGELVRGLGISDVRPSHAWRHLFVRRWRSGGASEEARDRIIGHSTGKVSERYDTTLDAPMLQEALEKLRPLPID